MTQMLPRAAMVDAIRLGLIVGSTLLCRSVSAQAPPTPAPAVSRPVLLVNHGYPRLSPDASRLLLVDDRDGDYEIHFVDLSTGAREQLTYNDAFDYAPSWSPTGEQIVFSSDRSGNGELWLSSVSSPRAAVRLTSTDGEEGHPRFSSDGHRIVFSRREPAHSSGAPGTQSIWMLDLRTGSERRLTQGSPLGDSYPELSPAGSHLLFRRLESDAQNSEIVVLDLETGREHAVAAHPRRDDYPTWSPDGAWIAFASDRRSDRPQGFDVYRVRADGSSLQRLTTLHEGVRFYHRPSFTPDGSAILANRGSPGRLEIVRVSLTESPGPPTVVRVPPTRD